MNCMGPELAKMSNGSDVPSKRMCMDSLEALKLKSPWGSGGWIPGPPYRTYVGPIGLVCVLDSARAPFTPVRICFKFLVTIHL